MISTLLFIRAFLFSIWERLARLHLAWRLLIKFIIFFIVVFFAHFPNPVLFSRQLAHFFNPEMLIQSDFPALAEINRDIDALLPPNPTRADEFLIVQMFVQQKIKYEFDWNNWGNADYWPTAEEVWARGKEDCDGRAILAASILRSRGFTGATIAGNIQHVWVVVDADELMGGGKEKNFTASDGRVSLSLPTSGIILTGMAFYLNHYPVKRILAMILAVVLLSFHPFKNFAALMGVVIQSLLGFILLLGWSGSGDSTMANLDFIAGILLLGFSPVVAALAPVIIIKARLRSSSMAAKDM